MFVLLVLTLFRERITQFTLSLYFFIVNFNNILPYMSISLMSFLSFNIYDYNFECIYMLVTT